MSAQPIDPRALKCAEELERTLGGLHEWPATLKQSVARIIQSHFAESVNGKLLEALQACRSWLGEKPNDDKDSPYENSLRAVIEQAEQAIALAQSQPPNMADELAEALREALDELNPETRSSSQRSREVFSGFESVLSRYYAQKGQS